MNGASRMELRLAVLLGDTALAPPPPVVAFWAEWARAGGSAMPDIPAFRAEVDKPDGVIMLLHRIRRALMKLGWLAAQSTPPPDARPLITSLTLAAADVYARNHAALARLDAGSPLQMRFKSALAAALVAASRFDRNVRIVRDAGCDEGLRAANVLTETPPEELAFETTLQACEAELLVAMQAGGTLEDRDKRLQRLRRLRDQGIPHPLAIRMALDDYEQDNEGARLMFGLPLESASKLRQDSALQASLQQTYGVQTYVYGPDARDGAVVDERAAWDELQGTLLNYVRAILDALEPDARNDTPVVPAGALPTKVFVSYSHRDAVGEVNWLQEVSTHLRVSAAQGTMVEWTDQQIEVGSDWLPAIEQALAHCGIAILLISKDFLDSDFVKRVEFPQLLARRKRDGLKVIAVVIKACDWEAVPGLASMELFRKGQTLALLRSEALRDSALAELARLVRTHSQPPR